MRREGGGGEEGREEEQLPSTRAVVDFLEDQGDSTMKTELKVPPPTACYSWKGCLRPQNPPTPKPR